MQVQKELNEWFGNLRGDVLAGLVSAFAVIPEVIGFCIVAGISPMMGLYASFCLTIILSFCGGRPAMVSAAAGSMALVIVGLVRDYGPEYLMACTILTGGIMFILGLCRVGNLIKLIPNTVMIGFVNALAILIFTAQLGNFVGEGWPMYAMVALGIAIIYLFPKLTKAVPSTLVAVIVVTAIAIFSKSDVRTIGDMGTITAALPVFALPMVPFNLETLMIILPFSLSIAIVGLVETLLTAQVIDEMTDSVGDNNRECCALGFGNFVSGFFGGTCGCAMIGQAILNVQSGGRGRLSTFVSGSFLMVLIFLLNDIMVQIPLAALVAVMLTVSIATFDWDSIRNLVKMPSTDALVIVLVVGVVVVTNNLAVGVVLGIFMTAIFFVINMSKLRIEIARDVRNSKTTYTIEGQLFFASTADLNKNLDFKEMVEHVVLDFSKTRLWDESAATAVKKTVDKFAQNGIQAEVVGLDESSSSLIEKLYGIKSSDDSAVVVGKGQ